MCTEEKKVLQTNKKDRLSGLELLKLIAMFLIIYSHVVQELNEPSSYVKFNDFAVNLGVATTNLSVWCLSIARHFGTLGNRIFYLCSVWFLLSSRKKSYSKGIKMFLTIWVISILFLCVMLIIRTRGGVHFWLIIKSFFPTILQSNWYATYYIVLCFTYPLLNTIVYKLKRKTLSIILIITAITFLISFALGFTYMPEVIIWFFMYLLVGYFKLYKNGFCENSKLNFIILICTVVCYLAFFSMVNYLGLNYPFFKNKLLFWHLNTSPFLLIIAFTVMNVFRKLHFKSKTVNYLSSLTLFLYVLHANIVFRSYYMAEIWQYIYLTFGYANILLYAIIFAIGLYVASIIVSIIVKHTIDKAVSIIVDKSLTFFKSKKMQ